MQKEGRLEIGRLANHSDSLGLTVSICEVSAGFTPFLPGSEALAEVDPLVSEGLFANSCFITST